MTTSEATPSTKQFVGHSTGSADAGLLSEAAPPIQLDADSLLRLLDSEILHARAEREKDGWSNWAVMLGIATVGSLILKSWQDPNLDVREAIAWAALFALVGEIVASVVVPPRNAGKYGRHRFRIGSLLGLRARALLFRGTIAIGTGVAVFAAGWRRYPWPSLAAAGFFIVIGAMFLIVALVLQRGQPVVSSPTRLSQTLIAIYYLLGSVAIVLYARTLRFPRPGNGVATLQVGVLLVIGVYLTLFLLTEQHREPLLESLVDIRRAFGLGIITAADASRQAKVILWGMDLGDWLEPNLRAVLADHDHLLSSERNALELSSLSQSDLALLDSDSSLTTPQRIAIAQRIRHRVVSIAAMVDDVRRIDERRRAATIEIASKIGYLRGVGGDQVGPADDIDAVLHTLTHDATKKRADLEMSLVPYREAIERELARRGL